MSWQVRGEANSVAGEIKKPGENDDNRKADDDEYDEPGHDPFGQVKRSEGDFTDLKQHPTDDRVGRNHRVDVAAPQLTGQLSPTKTRSLFHFRHADTRIAIIR